MVPLTLPVGDKVPVPPSLEVECTNYWVPMEETKQKWVEVPYFSFVVLLCVTPREPRRQWWPKW